MKKSEELVSLQEKHEELERINPGKKGHARNLAKKLIVFYKNSKDINFQDKKFEKIFTKLMDELSESDDNLI